MLIEVEERYILASKPANEWDLQLDSLEPSHWEPECRRPVEKFNSRPTISSGAEEAFSNTLLAYANSAAQLESLSEMTLMMQLGPAQSTVFDQG